MGTLTPQVSALVKVTHFVNSCTFLSLSSSIIFTGLADFYPASTNSSSASSGSSRTTSSSPTSRPSEPNGRKAGTIAGIAIGGSAALFAVVAAISYLYRKRRAPQRSGLAITPTNEFQDVTLVNNNSYWLQEMDGAGQSAELQAQSVQELDHPVPSVEMEAYQHY